jgi:hypothetical protein
MQRDVVCFSETSSSSAHTRLHPLPSSEFPVRWCACRSSARHTVLPEKLPLGRGCWLSELRSVPLVAVPVTGRDERARHHDSIPGRGRYFSLHRSLQTGCGANLASCSMGTSGSFPGGKSGRAADQLPPSSANFKNGRSCTSLTRRHNMVPQCARGQFHCSLYKNAVRSPRP